MRENGRVSCSVRELVDWMVGKTQRQAGAVLDYMHAHTRAETKDQLVGAVGRTFESNRYEQTPPTMRLPLIGQNRSIFIGNLGLFWIYIDRIIGNA